STESERNLEAFRHELRDLGWVEGQNLTIENRAAEGQVERLPALVADLLHLQVEVLVTTGGLSATSAAKAATNTLPIVMVTSADPVQEGLVASLARPGGNVTGVARACRRRSWGDGSNSSKRPSPRCRASPSS